MDCETETISCLSLYGIYWLLKMYFYGIEEASTKTDHQIINKDSCKYIKGSMG